MRREEMHQLLDAVLELGEKLAPRPLQPEVRQHMQAARREVLLGVRAMVDAAIGRTEAQPAAAGVGPASITIEAE